MAQTSWPFENIDTSETQYSQLFRNLGEGVVSGKELELEPFGDGTGMNVKVRSGQALVRGHYYYSTGIETLAIAAADPTNPRIDSVVLRLDPTANSILLAVITGTPNVSPSAPALTQTDSGIYEQLIANVSVAANETVIADGDVSDERTIYSPWTGSVTVTSADVTTATSDKSANYTLTSADKNTFIRSTGSAITITVPDVLANGESVNFIQAGAGQVTFAGSGVTINSADAKLKTNKQYSGATITKLGGAYYLVGDLAA
jgi:hypothetical protein